MAKLYFHFATMNAGKTTMLLQASYNYRERGMETMLFVAGHYRKEDGGYISSRIGLEAEAEMFRDGDDRSLVLPSPHKRHLPKLLQVSPLSSCPEMQNIVQLTSIQKAPPPLPVSVRFQMLTSSDSAPIPH
jgi:hypothetical protein